MGEAVGGGIFGVGGEGVREAGSGVYRDLGALMPARVGGDTLVKRGQEERVWIWLRDSCLNGRIGGCLIGRACVLHSARCELREDGIQ